MSDCLSAVFCDRDGVIIRDIGYLSNPDQIEVLDGVPHAIRILNKHGFLVVVVTNQSGVARGLYTESAVHQVNRVMAEQLAAQGAQIDAMYYCPHHPQGMVPQYRVDCDCRKPRPGMLLRAADELRIDLCRSFMIGDKESDIEAGANAGVRTVLIGSGAFRQIVEAGQIGQADKIAKTLLEAVLWILGEVNTDRLTSVG